MPLLRLDVGRLFSSLVGSSEARTRETILRAEAMSLVSSGSMKLIRALVAMLEAMEEQVRGSWQVC